MNTQYITQHATPFTQVRWWLAVLLFSSYAFNSSAQTVPESSPASTATSASQTTTVTQRVLGQNLFTGAFAQQTFAGFNPNYQLSVGDTVQVQLWGAVEFQGNLTVDAQGNIFIPQVGPVRLQGVQNSQVVQVVENAVKNVYRENVRVYANLNESQPVRLFVTGFVAAPGLYSGLSSDSLLSYLDRAGGIDPQRGSYLDIQLLRNNETLERISLYDFLLRGQLVRRQLQDGDTLLVGPRQFVVQFSGAVENPYAIEFEFPQVPLQQALLLARPAPDATHVRIERNSEREQTTDYFSLTESRGVMVQAGDRVELISDKSINNITVRVEGEYQGRGQFVLPVGATLGDLIDQIEVGPLADMESLQLYRRSVAERQRDMLRASLENLQMSVLTAPAATLDEANLRAREADLVLQFIDRARDIEPKGQVILANASNLRDITLQADDRIVIPPRSLLVTVYGEVMLPTAQLYRSGEPLKHYLDQAGGLSRKADRTRIVIRAPDGSVQIASLGKLFRPATVVDIKPGYEVMVLPEVDFKTLQFTKDIVQILYQSAIAAGVVLAL